MPSPPRSAGSSFGVAPTTSLAVVLVLGTAGMVATQPGGAYNDVVGLALILVAIASCCTVGTSPWPPGRLLLQRWHWDSRRHQVHLRPAGGGVLYRPGRPRFRRSPRTPGGARPAVHVAVGRLLVPAQPRHPGQPTSIAVPAAVLTCLQPRGRLETATVAKFLRRQGLDGEPRRASASPRSDLGGRGRSGRRWHGGGDRLAERKPLRRHRGRRQPRRSTWSPCSTSSVASVDPCSSVSTSAMSRPRW